MKKCQICQQKKEGKFVKLAGEGFRPGGYDVCESCHKSFVDYIKSQIHKWKAWTRMLKEK